MLDDTRLTPREMVGHNFNFLNIYNVDQACTGGEHREWLTELGSDDIERMAPSNKESIIRAQKPL